MVFLTYLVWKNLTGKLKQLLPRHDFLKPHLKSIILKCKLGPQTRIFQRGCFKNFFKVGKKLFLLFSYSLLVLAIFRHTIILGSKLVKTGKGILDSLKNPNQFGFMCAFLIYILMFILKSGDFLKRKFVSFQNFPPKWVMKKLFVKGQGFAIGEFFATPI